MCGITGFIDYNKQFNKTNISQMNTELRHRGPDDNGFFYYQSNCYNLAFGHTRLSILDLSTNSHQPMEYENLTLTYNGEIYNYKDIREELIKVGYQFHTTSDTEVLIKSFHKWGIKAVDKFIGMFSFSIYDATEKKVYMFRDRVGVKPFYYYFDNDKFVFASELKAILKLNNLDKCIDFQSVGEYLQYGYIKTPNSIFKNIKKIKAGFYIEYDLEKQNFNEYQYWDVKESAKNKIDISYNDAKDQIENLLISSFRYRMVSDVPVGVFLSGGYDSSAVASMLAQDNKIKTFTIGFENNNYDESMYAKQVATHINSEHYQHILKAQDIKDLFLEIPEILDEPMADDTILPNTFLAKFSSKYVKVVLSADGGDELFGGYNRYKQQEDIYKKLSKLSVFGKSINLFLNLLLRNNNHFFRYLLKKNDIRIHKILSYTKDINDFNYLYNVTMQNFTEKEISYLIGDYREKFNHYVSTNNYENMLQQDFKEYLQDDILVKVDRSTMYTSIEGREPFLDHRLIEFVSKLPIEYRKDKIILKDIVHKYIPIIIMQRPKKGFSIPLVDWLEDDFISIIDEFLNKKEIEKFNILNYKEVLYYKEKYLSGSKYYFIKLYRILILQMWLKRYLK